MHDLIKDHYYRIYDKWRNTEHVVQFKARSGHHYLFITLIGDTILGLLFEDEFKVLEEIEDMTLELLVHEVRKR